MEETSAFLHQNLKFELSMKISTDRIAFHMMCLHLKYGENSLRQSLYFKRSFC